MLNLEWYNLLNKPPLTPPGAVFAPAWIFLYLLIFASLIIYTTTKSRHFKFKGYVLFILQMILNISWTPVFFLLKNIHTALLIIILMDIATAFNIIEFKKISKASAILLIPYFIWILFATYLNIGLYLLN